MYNVVISPSANADLFHETQNYLAIQREEI